MYGWSELIVLGCVVVLFFSAKRLPEIVTSVRKIRRSFKEGVTGEESRPTRDVTEVKKD